MTSKFRAHNLLPLAILSLCIPAFGAASPDWAQRVCYVEHALHAFAAAGQPGEMFNIAALNLAYRDSVKRGKPLQSSDVTSFLVRGHHHIEALNVIATGNVTHDGTIVTDIQALASTSPYLAKVSADYVSARLLSPSTNILLATDVDYGANTYIWSRLRDQDAASFGRQALMAALQIGSVDAHFRAAFDAYYKKLASVSISSSQQQIIHADSLLPSPNLSDAGSGPAQLLAVLAQASFQQGDSATQQAILRAFLGQRTQSAYTDTTAAISNSKPGDSTAKVINQTFSDTKDIVDITGDILILSGDPSGQNAMRAALDLLKIGQSIAILVFAPEANPFEAVAGIFGGISDLAGLSSGSAAAMTQQLMLVQKQLKAIQQTLTTQFTQINNKLNQILITMITQFSNIENALVKIEDGLQIITDQLVTVIQASAYVDIDLSDKLLALSQENEATDIDKCLQFEALSPKDQMSHEMFVGCASSFMRAAVTDSRDAVHAGGSSNGRLVNDSALTDLSVAPLLQKDLADPFSNADVIDKINTILITAKAPPGSRRVPNIQDWMTAALAYIQLLDQSFELRGTEQPQSQLAQIIQTGQDIQTSVIEMSTGKTSSDQTAFFQATALYSNTLELAKQAIDAVEKSYRGAHHINTNLSELDLWNGPLQDTSFAPPPVQVAVGTGQITISGGALHRVLPPVFRTALQLGMITPRTDIPPYGVSPSMGFDFINGHGASRTPFLLPFCLSVSGLFSAPPTLPDGSTTADPKFSQAIPGYPYSSGSGGPLAPYQNSSALLCNVGLPYAEGQGSNVNNPLFNNWLIGNWQTGANLQGAFESGATTFFANLGFPGNPETLIQMAGSPSLAAALPAFHTAWAEGGQVESIEQGLDFYRSQVATEILKALNSPTSDLSQKLALVANAKQILKDLILIGMSNSAESDPTLKRLLDGPDAVAGRQDVGNSISQAFGVVTTQRTQELDNAAIAEWNTTQHFYFDTWMGSCCNAAMWVSQSTSLGQRIGFGNATTQDIATLAAFPGQLLSQEPTIANNARQYLTVQLDSNSQTLTSLNQEVAAELIKNPNGEPLASIQAVIELLQLNEAIWQATPPEQQQRTCWLRTLWHRIFSSN
jgi:hypothetical protein